MEATESVDHERSMLNVEGTDCASDCLPTRGRIASQIGVAEARQLAQAVIDPCFV